MEYLMRIRSYRLITANRSTEWLKKICSNLPCTLVCILFYCLSASSTQAESGEDIFSIYGDESFVSIATGRKQALKKAPAVASVITAEDIRAMGAKDLDEVLETVPGIHVARHTTGYNPIYVIRGIYSEYNPQVLMLVNGIPITSSFLGDRTQVWGGFPLESVLRIEVIRGPGSALYGADAYAGTINIITKSAEQSGETDSGVLYGSHNEKRAWLNTQHISESGYGIFASLEYLNTDGANEQVTADGQTMLDQIFNTSASLAPGQTELRREAIDARLEIKKQLITFRAGYQERNNFGSGTGANQSLDPVGEGNAKRFNSDLIYHDQSFTDNWDVKAQLSYFDIETLTELRLAPPGAYGNSFPEGVFGSPDVYERHWRSEFSGFYSGMDDHELRIGIGYQYLDQYKIEESKNFNIQLVNGMPLIVPLGDGSVVDVTDSMPFNQEKTRKIHYLFIQDEWNIAPDWSLTAGLRYDHFSDFGETINPRFALVWQTSYALTSKFLYGRAFRAPSFAELFNINNPLAVGNSSLDPELIDTYEIAFNYEASAKLTMGLNLFYYEMKDIIRFNPYIAENASDQTGHGLEFETTWTPWKQLRVSGNYSWQSSEDKETGEDAANAPEHQLYIQSDLEFIPGWHANIQVNRVMGRNRAPSDLRDDVPDYTEVDLLLRATQLIPSWEFSAGVRNATDEDIYEPSLAPGLIPNDLPQAGRSYFAEIRKSF